MVPWVSVPDKSRNLRSRRVDEVAEQRTHRTDQRNNDNQTPKDEAQKSSHGILPAFPGPGRISSRLHWTGKAAVIQSSA